MRVFLFFYQSYKSFSSPSMNLYGKLFIPLITTMHAIHNMYYNFCRINKAIQVTPAMEAGLTQDIWTAEDIVKLAYPDGPDNKSRSEDIKSVRLRKKFQIQALPKKYSICTVA
jgi:hypothetical protein